MSSHSSRLPQMPLLATILSLVLLSTGCGLADIRPDTIKQYDDVPDEREKRGRQLLQQVADAHGGRDKWEAAYAAKVTYRDEWPRLIPRLFAMPWPSSDVLITQTMLLGMDTSRLTFQEGKKEGISWGIQNWATYKVTPSFEEPLFVADKTIWFWLPTMQYFFEAPFRLLEADVVFYAGTKSYLGSSYEVVYLTWESVEPNEQVDQYVAWIEPNTKRLVFLQYTVRDQADFLTGTAFYKDFRSVDGFVVARQISIASMDSPKKILHETTFEDVAFGVDPEPGTFYPDPEVFAPKSAQGAARKE